MKFLNTFTGSIVLVLSSTPVFADSSILGVPTIGFVTLSVIVTAVVVGALVYILWCNKSGVCEQSELIRALNEIVKSEDFATTINPEKTDPKLVAVINALLESASNKITMQIRMDDEMFRAAVNATAAVLKTLKAA